MKDENDDISIDFEGADESVLGEEINESNVKKLREKIKEAESKAKEYLDGWQRAQADFVNLRKRDEEAKIDFIKFAKIGLIEELIPVLDSFNIALSHSSVNSESETNIKPIFDQLLGVLKNAGLEEIDPSGQAFSPHEHEALGMINTEKEADDQKVLEVLQKGYKFNGKVIRPAKVRVGEYINNPDV